MRKEHFDGYEAFIKGWNFVFLLIWVNLPLILNPNPREPNQCGSMLIQILYTVYKYVRWVRELAKELRICEFLHLNFRKPSTSRPPVPACPVLVKPRLLNKGK
jgi:hypothetical protein